MPSEIAEIWELRRGSGRTTVADQLGIPVHFVDFANHEAQLDAMARDLAKSASPGGDIAEAELSRDVLESRFSEKAAGYVRREALRIFFKHWETVEETLLPIVAEAVARVDEKDRMGIWFPQRRVLVRRAATLPRAAER
jgi:hypothetical protein